MARIAVISDIHANLPALRAVLADIRRRRIRDIICLGDLVGYGPAPAECLNLAIEHCRIVVRGNHDEAVFNPGQMNGFNAAARVAINWTRATLTPEEIATLRLLPHVAWFDQHVMCIHDCPAPGPSDYVYDAQMAAVAFRAISTRICAIGHTHVPAVFEAPRQTDDEWLLSPRDIRTSRPENGRPVSLDPACRAICNPGSVGQPRDNDPRASFGVLDLKQRTFTVHRVEYDIAAAQEATRRAGLPPFLAERLAKGA